eukprot:Lithocolla_globosa_v1_NODE_16_length_10446_cov_10.815802.p2 type:complete len:527 gc:universal NODE_16_length_10446_cov_10.815802:5917-7497(+)
MPMKHLCRTNAKRIAVNDKTPKIFIQNNPGHIPRPIVFKEESSNEKVVDWTCNIIPGMPVICECAEGVRSLGVTKGDTFTINGWRKDSKNIDVILLKDFNNRDYEVPETLFHKKFRIAFAITVHKSQGSTIDKPYMLHETNKYDWRMMNVALGRTADSSLIMVDRSHATLKAPVIPQPVSVQAGEHRPLLSHLHEDGMTDICKTFRRLNDIDPDGIVVRDQSNLRFHVFPSVDNLEKAITYPNQTLHEVVLPKTVQRVYFDIDLKVSEFKAIVPDVDAISFADELIDSIRKTSLEYVSELEDAIVNPDKKYIDLFTRTYTSSSDSKLSYHIMLPIYCGGYAQPLARSIFLEIRKRVMTQFPKIPAGLLEKILDSGMSKPNGSLRMLGSVKDKTFDRPKLDIQEDDLDGDLFASLIGWYDSNPFNLPPIYVESWDEKFKTEKKPTAISSELQTKIIELMTARIPDFTETWSFRSDSLMCDRRKPSYCENCGRTHENDNTLYFTVWEGSIFQRCFKSKKGLYVGKLHD